MKNLENAADSGLPGTKILLLHLPTASLQIEPESKDIKRACACYIQPFIVIDDLFYRSSSRLGSELHSEA